MMENHEMHEADRRDLEAHLIARAQLEVLQMAQQLQHAQAIQAAQINCIAATLPSISETLRDMTELLRTLCQNTPVLPPGGIGLAPQKPAPQNGGAVLSLVASASRLDHDASARAGSSAHIDQACPSADQS